MKFGKIAYLNLLPFDVFAKKYGFCMQKTYPSALNKKFLHKKIDAGFISSIAGIHAKKQSKATHAGIVANKKVWSVISIPKQEGQDYQSDTSNALREVLGISGRILIGDRALKYKLSGREYVDLAQEWHKRHRLPFVFGMLCFNSNKKTILKISEEFTKTKVKIPYYILKESSQRTQIPTKDILSYLKLISYKISNKELKSLEIFYREILLKRIKTPSRF